MNTKLLGFSLLGFFLILAILIINIASKFNNSEKDNKFLNIPAVSLNWGEEKFQLPTDLHKEKNTIITFLSTECTYCKYQAMDIANNIKKLSELNNIIIIQGNEDTGRLFCLENGLEEDCSTLIFFINEEEFQENFGELKFPTTLIYNEKQQLIKMVKGESKVDNLLSYYI